MTPEPVRCRRWTRELEASVPLTPNLGTEASLARPEPGTEASLGTAPSIAAGPKPGRGPKPGPRHGHTGPSSGAPTHWPDCRPDPAV